MVRAAFVLLASVAVCACGDDQTGAAASMAATGGGATASGGGGSAGQSGEGGEQGTGGAPPPPTVALNEIASGADSIELFNFGSATSVLNGWSVTDDQPNEPGHRYVFPAGSSLAAGDYQVIVKDTDFQFGLGDIDVVLLYDQKVVLVDVAYYDAGQANVSYCRIPDGTGPFKTCSTATFGAMNQR